MLEVRIVLNCDKKVSIVDLGPTDVKYPPNVGRGLSSADLEVDRLYEPKQNKKIVRSV